MPQNPPVPSMRAPTPWEGFTQSLRGGYEALSQQPLLALAQKLGLIPGDLMPPTPADQTDIQNPGNWSIGVMPPPGRISLPGSPAPGVRGPIQTGGVGNIELPAGPPPGPPPMPRPVPRVPSPIPGTTLDDILAAGEAQYPGAGSIQVIEPGTGAVIDPVREAAIKLARLRAGK